MARPAPVGMQIDYFQGERSTPLWRESDRNALPSRATLDYVSCEDTVQIGDARILATRRQAPDLTSIRGRGVRPADR